MHRITHNSFNGKFFHEMQKEELQECLVIIMQMINAYKPSISGVCISDQEHQRERWSAWQNANFNLNKLM